MRKINSMKIDQEKLTNLVYDAILRMFDDNDPNLINPDFLNDPEYLTRFFYALSITGPHKFFNDLSNKEISCLEFHSLVGEILEEL